MSPPPAPSVRLFVLLAAEAPRAVVLRRGPTALVLQSLWHTDTDRLEHGQWLKGRVYERRCDLSPRGERLAYFAAQWRKPLGSWTAIARPPWFTALALWPKGDAWGGGGLWLDERTLALNHGTAAPPTTEAPPPAGALRVEPFSTQAGLGEDEPIWSARLRRSGWQQVERGAAHPDDEFWYGKAALWIRYDPPRAWEKQAPRGSAVLRMELRGIKERNGPWYLLHCSLRGPRGAAVELGRIDWADFALDGDLLLARDGQLWRARGADLSRLRALHDLRPLRFEPREAPAWAKRWDSRRPG